MYQQNRNRKSAAVTQRFGTICHVHGLTGTENKWYQLVIFKHFPDTKSKFKMTYLIHSLK